MTECGVKSNLQGLEMLSVGLELIGLTDTGRGPKPRQGEAGPRQYGLAARITAVCGLCQVLIHSLSMLDTSQSIRNRVKKINENVQVDHTMARALKAPRAIKH